MVENCDNLFLQVPVGEMSTNDSFGILNEDEMKDFTFGGESFCSVLKDDHQVVNDSLSTSMVLTVDTKASLKSLVSESVKDEDSYVKNNSAINENFTHESNEEASILSDERVRASKRVFDTIGGHKEVNMQGLFNSTFGKDDSFSNHVEIKFDRNISLVEKAGIDVLRSKSGYLIETFDAEASLEDEDRTYVASKLKFSPKSKTNLLSVQMSLRNNNEFASSSSCHSTSMKDMGEVVSSGDSTSYGEKKNKAISDQCLAVSPSSATENILSGSNLSIPDDVVGDVIKDETFDGKMNPNKTFEKFELCNRSNLDGQKSLSNLSSQTYVSQGYKNSTFEKNIDGDGFPHDEEVGIIVTEYPVSPKNVLISQENLNEVKEVRVSMPMECDEFRIDSKGMYDNGPKFLLNNSRLGTNNFYDSNSGDKLLIKRVKLDKIDSLVKTNVRKPKLNSSLVQHAVKKSVVPSSRNNLMNKPGEKCTGTVRLYSKLNMNTKMSLTGGNKSKAGVKLVQERNETHQSGSRSVRNNKCVGESKLGNQLGHLKKQISIPALGKESSRDTRSVGDSKVRKQLSLSGFQRSISTALGKEAYQNTSSVNESKFRKQVSQSGMQISAPSTLDKETCHIKTNIPGILKNSGIPMPTRVSTSSLKLRSQIPTSIKLGR